MEKTLNIKQKHS